MVRSRLIVAALSLAAVLSQAQFAKANNLDATYTLTLDSNLFTVQPGGEFTLRGYLSTPDAVTFAYSEEGLGGYWQWPFGLAPVLGLTGGSYFWSASTPYEFSEQLSGGYLGPQSLTGPGSTPDSDLRTFVVPEDTAPGTYDYNYGISLRLICINGCTYGGTSARFTVIVPGAEPVPEPASLTLLGTGIAALGIFRRRRA